MPEPDEPAAADDEPYVRLPRPQPRWLQWVTEIDMAMHLAVFAILLVMILAGAVGWAFRVVTWLS